MNKFFSSIAMAGSLALALSACAETDVEDDAAGNADETSVAADAMPADRPAAVGDDGALPDLAEGYSRYNCKTDGGTMWVDVAEDGMKAHSGYTEFSEKSRESDKSIDYNQFGVSEGANPEGGSAKPYLMSDNGYTLDTADDGSVIIEGGAKNERVVCNAAGNDKA